MTDKKQTIQFDMEYNQGYTCWGGAVIEDLTFEVAFTDEEIAQMRQLVSQRDKDHYSDGLMSVLGDDAPELHERIDSAARDAIFDFLVEDGINNGYIEFDEDELRSNFLKDYNLTEDQFDKSLYDEWHDEEMERIDCSGLRWISARYSVVNSVTMEDNPDYTVAIPSVLQP